MALIDEIRVRQVFDPTGENGGYQFEADASPDWLAKPLTEEEIASMRGILDAAYEPDEHDQNPFPSDDDRHDAYNRINAISQVKPKSLQKNGIPRGGIVKADDYFRKWFGLGDRK